jgi:hypothetical protein
MRVCNRKAVSSSEKMVINTGSYASRAKVSQHFVEVWSASTPDSSKRLLRRVQRLRVTSEHRNDGVKKKHLLLSDEHEPAEERGNLHNQRNCVHGTERRMGKRSEGQTNDEGCQE